MDFGMAREYVHADGRMRNPRALTGFRPIRQHFSGKIAGK
ncbi:unnamed protein product [Anisakis simplex]|uniref:Uncharacterized protein n=1 Tax=Anisakis simplex TaxID=6269 RepID=A0A3P6QB12_ANISI|nr:unnamed protein product [Anisakis simplex]